EQRFRQDREERGVGGGTRRAQRLVPRLRERRLAPPQRVGRLARQPDPLARPAHVEPRGEQPEEALPAFRGPPIAAARAGGKGLSSIDHNSHRLVRTKRESSSVCTKGDVGKWFFAGDAKRPDHDRKGWRAGA